MSLLGGAHEWQFFGEWLSNHFVILGNTNKNCILIHFF